MEPNKDLRKLAFTQLLIGIGAMAGGLGVILDPTGGNSGVTEQLLKGTPFPDYFIPGLFLFIVIGFSHAFGAIIDLKKDSNNSFLGIGNGIVLCSWIIIQVYFIGYQTLLQPIILLVGVYELLLGIKLFKSEKRRKIG